MRWTSRLARTGLWFASLALAPAAGAQSPAPGSPLIHVVQRWIGLPTAPGRERFATDRIQAADRGWTRDALGDLVKTRGSGAPVRVVACGLDAPAYMISQITDDGYLRVQMDGNGARRPLWDDFHLGQRILVETGNPATPDSVKFVPGVFLVRSTHLWRGQPATNGVPTVDDLWIDVGARNAAEASRMGIRLLDPVFRDLPPWQVANYVTGPDAASRAGCAAVEAASQGTPATGTDIFVIAVQSSFNWSGLTGVLSRTHNADSVIVVTASRVRAADTTAAVGVEPMRLASLAGMHVGAAYALAVRSRYPNTLVESVSSSDLRALFERVASAADVRTTAKPAMPVATLPIAAERHDSLSRDADLLARLTDRYAVSGHEGPVRDLIRDALPAWAKSRAVVDSAGNMYVAVGPDRDTVVIVAHMDEVGFDVAKVNPDGLVELRMRGGFYTSLWAGQPALLHRDTDVQGSTGVRDCAATSATALKGVFVPPDDVLARNSRTVYAWFGPDPAALGVAPGMTVTAYKCATRLGALRFTARAIDDRAGDTSLLLAMDMIDPAKLDHKVIFAFSTREEIGLNGAEALAAEFRTSVRRVLAIDTFVSSDSPLEDKRFADTPIGMGPVARMMDNSSVTPPDEMARLFRIAAAHGIPLQNGTTNGGNDGSAFTRYGVVDVPIGWPLRDSHSPAEVIDLRDVRSLARLVAALAVGR
ncbi:MAG TPA: M20/M25/M40 family metallo-hydrolase [Gemmatimonadaceae bacterium]|nr:M20/M25/M40 family metallo-hydrolase [Gemmatimonadaceae bacterium]